MTLKDTLDKTNLDKMSREMRKNMGKPWLVAVKDPYACARQDHVAMLKAEGFTFREIGPRLGITGSAAHVLMCHFKKRAMWGTRKAIWRWDSGAEAVYQGSGE